MGKNLESACKAYFFQEFNKAEMAATVAAEKITAAGGVKLASKELVAEFAAAIARQNELSDKMP